MYARHLAALHSRDVPDINVRNIKIAPCLSHSAELSELESLTHINVDILEYERNLCAGPGDNCCHIGAALRDIHSVVEKALSVVCKLRQGFRCCFYGVHLFILSGIKIAPRRSAWLFE